MNRLVVRCRRFLCALDFHSLRKLVVAVVGGSVVLVGVALLVLPGPAFLVIPLGLAILATEFLWARRWLKRARAMLPNGDQPPTPPGPAAAGLGAPETAPSPAPPAPDRRPR